MVLVIPKYVPVISYFCLLKFNFYISQDKDYKHNSLLICAINELKDKGQERIPDSLIFQYKPRSEKITRSVFERGASFPTGQILLEFLTVETNSSGHTEGYLDVVYLQHKSNNQYENLGTFRKFTP